MRMWGGRFEGGPDARMADFTRSIEVDAELALDDIEGSIAHVRGARARGAADHGRGGDPGSRAASPCAPTSRRARRAWDPALEDVHLNLETRSPSESGRSRGKLHTGRSRNDQVATDLRLWTRRRSTGSTPRSSTSSGRWSTSRSARARRSCPGTTHIQPAQPVLFAHHLLAYVEMLERDRGRFARRAARG